MELSILRRSMIQGFKLFGLDEQTILMLSLILKKDWMADEMLDFMVDNPQARKTDFILKTIEITNKMERANDI